MSPGQVKLACSHGAGRRGVWHCNNLKWGFTVEEKKQAAAERSWKKKKTNVIFISVFCKGFHAFWNMRLFENLWSRFLNVKCIQWLPKLTGNLEPWILFSLSYSQFIMLPWAEYLFLWAGMLLPSLAVALTRGTALVVIGYQGPHGGQTCAQNQELRTHLWRGDRCDIMT